MQDLEETTDIEKIDTQTMYKMIQSLLNYNLYYEVKCLVNLFIEKRTNKDELVELKKIRDIMFTDSDEAKEILEQNIQW